MSNFKCARLTTPDKSWFDLPAEMREMVIDQMDTKTRLKFMQCSTLCEKEGKASKNYSKQIMLHNDSHLAVFIGHDKKEFDYFLEFMDIVNHTKPQSIVTYKTIAKDSPDIIKWTKVEDGKANDVRTRYVNGFFEKNGNAITEIEVINENNANDFPVEKCSLKHLKNLESIVIECNHDLLESGVLDLKQILRADCADVTETKLSFSQVLQFEGSKLVVKSNEFNEENIRKFLKMWKNGEVNQNMKCLCIELVNPKGRFNGDKIVDGLDIYEYSQCNKECIFRFRSNNQRKKDYYTEVICSAEYLSVVIETDEKSS